MDANRRDQIIEAALALFQQRGFAAVSTRDLADAAGLSRSHLYHYFEDWRALRRAAFDRFAAGEFQHARRELTGLPPKTALKRFLEASLPTKRDAFWALWMDAWDESLHDKEFAVCYMDAMHHWQAILKDIIDQGISKNQFTCRDSACAARQILALTSGYAHDLLLIPSPKSAKTAYAEVADATAQLLGLSSL
jgi:AcrR family transcriptional regulator